MTHPTMIRSCDIYDGDVKPMHEDLSIFLITDRREDAERIYVARPRGKMMDWEILYEITSGGKF